jgi:hypothetical protein
MVERLSPHWKWQSALSNQTHPRPDASMDAIDSATTSVLWLNHLRNRVQTTASESTQTDCYLSDTTAARNARETIQALSLALFPMQTSDSHQEEEARKFNRS